MKPLLALITLIYLLAMTSAAMAQGSLPDSLVERLKRNVTLRSSFELGQLDVRAYTMGESHCQKQGLAGRLVPHLLPFQANPSRDVGFEAFSHIHYQWPGDMHLNITALNANQPRKAKYVMRELYQAILPIYATRRHKDYGSNKSFVLPFYGIGPRRYTYELTSLPDTLLDALQTIGLDIDTSRLCCISFTPTRRHHTLLSGRLLIDSTDLHILGFDCKGRIDMATFRSRLLFSPDSLHGGLYFPHSSQIDIDYHYLKTRGRNSYRTRYRYLTFTPFDSLQREFIPYDLTPYYQQEALTDSLDFELMRPFDLYGKLDTLLNHHNPTPTSTHKRKKLPIENFSETLVSGSSLGSDNNRLRIYGPLDPASLGYDHFNGVTVEERARWRHRFADNSQLYVRLDLGYAFKLREIRFRWQNEWTYLPARRGRFTLEARRSNSNFSSKYINSVNEAFKERPGGFNFESLGLKYYQRYEVMLEHSIELTNGLMFYCGILDTYRRPVKKKNELAYLPHYARTVDDDVFDNHFSDFAPYIRLEYTPRQYYWYDRGYKTYIHSPAPTFAFEFARAIPGVLRANSNYGRIEFDMHQSFNIDRTQSFAYRFGLGKFFNQRGEYFINYHYFSRSQYPTTWEDDRIGGTFHELDEMWYASSPSYIQLHTMYETPFGLAHLIRPISRYVIKERFYMSALWSEGKHFYDELGYGIDNNYFNIGVFAGFKGLNYHGMGVKFRIEIGRHL